MARTTPLPIQPDCEEVKRGEDLFVALARSYEMTYYLGRLTEATEEELRCLYGITVAALRQASRDIAAGAKASGPVDAPPASTAAPEVLSSRLEEMTAELAQRDARIRELTTKLERRRKRD